MTHKALPPPPIRNPMEHNAWIGPDGYFSRLQTRVNTDGQIEWSQLLTEGSNLTDIEIRKHTDLTEIGTNTHAEIDTHLAKTNLNAHGNTIDATITFDDGVNIVIDTVTGTQIGTSITQKLSFYGGPGVTQPTALTAQDTTITHTAPGTPDYALQDLTDSGVGSTWGFATQDEGNTLLKVVANLQTRVSELEAKLQSLGLLA